VTRETIGPLLARLRRERGWSQPRVADLLNTASGNPTLTRHEISRWEREKPVPTRYWLEWLAIVFDVPLDQFERAIVDCGRRRRGDSAEEDWDGCFA
jgi:transcriptional regulator with XRE-family HTH domain